MEDVAVRYERLMGEMNLDDFLKHLKDHSLPYTRSIRNPIDKPMYIVITPMNTEFKERYFGRDKQQFSITNK